MGQATPDGTAFAREVRRVRDALDRPQDPRTEGKKASP
jgi:hypothetical protein